MSIETPSPGPMANPYLSAILMALLLAASIIVPRLLAPQTPGAARGLCPAPRVTASARTLGNNSLEVTVHNNSSTPITVDEVVAGNASLSPGIRLGANASWSLVLDEPPAARYVIVRYSIDGCRYTAYAVIPPTPR